MQRRTEQVHSAQQPDHASAGSEPADMGPPCHAGRLSGREGGDALEELQHEPQAEEKHGR